MFTVKQYLLKKIVIIHLIPAQGGELITIKSRANITENQVEVLKREAEGLLKKETISLLKRLLEHQSL